MGVPYDSLASLITVLHTQNGRLHCSTHMQACPRPVGPFGEVQDVSCGRVRMRSVIHR